MEELCGVEGTLLQLEEAEGLVESMGLYSGEQELMDMQLFIKSMLLELQQLQLPEPLRLINPKVREPMHFVPGAAASAGGARHGAARCP